MPVSSSSPTRHSMTTRSRARLQSTPSLVSTITTREKTALVPIEMFQKRPSLFKILASPKYIFLSCLILLLVHIGYTNAEEQQLQEKPTLHMIGLFHTITSLNYSHCAFTGKVLRFSRMMHRYGWKVVEYGNVLTESGADEFVPLMNWTEFLSIVPQNNAFHGDIAQIGTPWHRLFEERLLVEMKKHVKPYDIICHPFGRSHEAVVPLFSSAFHVESGIGYPDSFLSLRIFESYAKMHYTLGQQRQGGKNYNWVIPNYYDVFDWRFVKKCDDDRPIVFMGRLTEVKGMSVIKEIAERMPERRFLIAGQGDPSKWFANLTNVEYVGVLVGRERHQFLSRAYAMLMPTTYVEPFGGAGVEAQLVGVPLISSNYGCFAETIEHGQSGFRCNTLGDWLEAIRQAEYLDRKYISDRARSLYGLDAVGKQYDAVFKMIYDLKDGGWYKNVSYTIPDLSRH